jgi:hypothetical protein
MHMPLCLYPQLVPQRRLRFLVVIVPIIWFGYIGWAWILPPLPAPIVVLEVTLWFIDILSVAFLIFGVLAPHSDKFVEDVKELWNLGYVTWEQKQRKLKREQQNAYGSKRETKSINTGKSKSKT